MITNKIIRIGVFVSILCLTFSTQAEVSFVGNDWDTNSKWRDPSVVKDNDVDQDNIYGTLGYWLAAGLRAGYKDPFLGDNILTGGTNTDDINELPDFITSIEFTDPTEVGRSWGGKERILEGWMPSQGVQVLLGRQY